MAPGPVGSSPPPAVTDPRQLAGCWTLHRRVADYRTGQHGRMEGTLTVTPDAGGARWEEEGVLAWGGHDLPVRRGLALRVRDGQWWMTFADGSPFHPWVPGEVVVHPCRADTYRGLLRLDATGQGLRILWEVTGPAKHQRLFTRCERRP